MPIPTSLIYTPRNSKILSIGPVIDSTTRDAITDATVTATLRTVGPYGEAVSGGSIALDGDGEGNYSGEIDGIKFNPSPGANYVTWIDLTTPAGMVAHWEIPSVVEVRLN